jgi:hypothetical protein
MTSGFPFESKRLTVIRRDSLAPGRRVRRDRTALRFATVEVDQSGCRARREANLRAAFQRVTALASDELVELACSALPVRGWRNKLRNNPSVSSYYHVPPSIRRIYRLRLSFNSRMPVSMFTLQLHVAILRSGRRLPACTLAISPRRRFTSVAARTEEDRSVAQCLNSRRF